MKDCFGKLTKIFLILVFLFSRVTASERKTATAVIYEPDKTWGTVVFHQWTKTSPVIFSALFQNIQLNQDRRVEYEIRTEPVHYDLFSDAERCTDRALKHVMKAKGKTVGDLVRTHRMKPITTSRFAEVVYDREISLYSDMPNNIVGKSFVIKQGDKESDYRCATIYMSDLESQRPGAIPCEFKQYSDCLVGTAKEDKCVYKPCSGYRQYWGPITRNTMMCAPTYEVYPKATERATGTSFSGVVPCKHGNYTLLRPIDTKTYLL